MRTYTFLSCLVAIAALVGCGNSTTANGAAAGPDAGGPDASAADDGGIGGVDDLSLTVVQRGTPANAPLAGAFVRVSTSATRYVETKTDAMGVAHVQVDLTKAPFDVTVALAGFSAVSILDVAASIPGSVVLSPIHAAPSAQQFTVSGSIAGVGSTNELLIAGFAAKTAVTNPGDTQYSTTFDAANALVLSAIEVDGSMPFGIAINGYVTQGMTTMPGPLTIPVAMPSPAVPAHQSSITVHWPTAGIFTAASIKGAGAPGQEIHIQPGFVEKLATDGDGPRWAVGLADVDAPSNGSSVLHLQTFAGDMSPDLAGIEVTTVAPMGAATTSDYAAFVYAHTLTGTASVDVGQVDAISVGGTSLGDATFAVASTGYDSIRLVVSSTQGTTSTPIWIIHAPGGRVASRGLPYLPSGIALADLGGTVSNAELAAEVVKYVKNGATPWQAIVQDQSHRVGSAKGVTLSTIGR